MGWQKIPWYTMTDDFDADFGVDEWHGTNAFIREGDNVYRTYLINSRGDEAMGSTWASSTSPPSAARRSGRTRPGLPADPAVRVVELPRRLQQEA